MRKITLLFLLLCVALGSRAQSAYTYDSDVTRDWFRLQNMLVKEGTGFTPPVASRAFGYSGLALYEALVSGMPDRLSLQSQLSGLTITPPNPSINYHWPSVANNCLAIIVDSLWANATADQKDSIHCLQDYYNGVFGNEPTFIGSRNYGETVAKDVFAWSKSDGGHQGYLTNTDPNYVPPTGAGLWVPTLPNFGMALQPHWGDNRPYVAASVASPVIPVAPPVFSTDTNSAFYGYAYQVYATVNDLAPGQVIIANYWADGPNTVSPPGHSMSILTQIMEAEDENLGYAAYAYAKLGMSQADAFISCWRTKFTYNLIRPLSYIQNYIDSTWLPIVETPPFPEYTSGHSSQSGAMTAVMNDLYGSTYGFTDSTHGTLYGGPRNFLCFDEAAYEAATSRMFGGIHYEFSDVFAITLGKMVGDNINELFNNVTVQSEESSVPRDVSISFYPNPTPDYALISYQGFQLGKIKVFGMDGRLVSESTNTAVLELRNLPAGQYLLKVYDRKDREVSNQRIVRI